MTEEKTCYCYVCQKPFHALGISRHRAMHRDKKEYCKIQYTDYTVKEHLFDGKPYEYLRRRDGATQHHT